MKKDKKNLLGCNLSEIEVIIADLGYRKFHAKQILKWVHKRYITDIAEMTDLSNDLRDKLNKSTEIELPALISEDVSKDGTTNGSLILGRSGIETVYIPELIEEHSASHLRWAVLLIVHFSNRSSGFQPKLKCDEIISAVFCKFKSS